MGIRRKPKNHYKKTPSERRPFIFRHFGFLLKTGFALSLFVMMSFFSILGYNRVVQWNYLNAKAFSVKGNTLLSAEQIIKQSQLNIGENILSMNLSASKKSLLANPMISHAEIVRNFPSGITIRVKEHHPMAILDLGRKFAINYAGEIFIEIPSSGFKNIPIIVGFAPSDIDTNGEIKGIPFGEAIKILHLGQKADSILSADTIKRIEVDKQTGLTVNTFGRIKTIKLGYGDYSIKYERLKTIFAFLNERPDLKDYISVDLNNLKRIVLKTS